MSSENPVSRRTVLRWMGIAAGAAAVGCGPTGEPAEVIEEALRPGPPTTPWSGLFNLDLASFPMGVSSGDPLQDGVMLWTKLAQAGEVSVSVSIWDGEGWSEAQTREVSSNEAGFVHVDWTDLPADTPVAFQFHQGEAGSAVGQTRTAPSADTEGDITLGLCACLNQRRGEFPMLQRLVESGPVDAMIFVGDTVYTDSYSTVEEYRDLYQRQLTSVGFAELLPAVPTIFTLDDHEVGNNFDPETVDPTRFEETMTCWFDNLPVRPPGGGKVWRSFRMGKAVEVFVLDCRTERRASKELYISEEQMAWLKEGLSSSDAVWKVIANSVPIVDLPEGVWDVRDSDLDRWEGFPAQREELLSHITDSDLSGVVFFSGDLHFPAFCRLEAEGPRSKIFEILGGPGGVSVITNLLGPTLEVEDRFYYAGDILNVAKIRLGSDGTGQVWIIDDDGIERYTAKFNTDAEVWDEARQDGLPEEDE